MDLASLYIILGSISFITSVVTLGVLIKKFIEQPAAHGFFVYSDTIASALLSLGLLLDGVLTHHHILLLNYFHIAGDLVEAKPGGQELLPVQASLRPLCRCHCYWVLLGPGYVGHSSLMATHGYIFSFRARED